MAKRIGGRPYKKRLLPGLPFPIPIVTASGDSSASDSVSFTDSAVASLTAVATASDSVSFTDSAVGSVPGATPEYDTGGALGLGEDPSDGEITGLTADGTNSWMVGASLTGMVFGTVGDTTAFKFGGSSGTDLTQRGTDQSLGSPNANATVWDRAPGPSGSTSAYAAFSGPPQTAVIATALYTNVDQTTPVAGTADASGDTDSVSSLEVSVTVTGTVAGERVVAVFQFYSPDTDLAPASPVSGSELRHSAVDTFVGILGIAIADTVATGSTTTVSVQLETNQTTCHFYWVARALRVTGASGGGGGITVDASDTITLSDSAVAQLSAVATAADTLTVSDSATALLQAVATASDTASFTDSATAGVQFTAAGSDTLTVSDSATAVLQAVAAASDTFSPSDSATALLQAAAAGSDSLSLTDSAVAVLQAVATASDTLTLTDSATAGLASVAEAADTLTLTDSATATVALEGVASDSITLTDSAVAETALTAAAADTLTLSDSAVAQLQATAAGADTLALTDSATALLQGVAAASDSLALTDSAVAQIQAVATASDSIALTDSATASRSSVAVTGSDSVTFTDSATATTVGPTPPPTPGGLPLPAKLLGNAPRKRPNVEFKPVTRRKREEEDEPTLEPAAEALPELPVLDLPAPVSIEPAALDPTPTIDPPPAPVELTPQALLDAAAPAVAELVLGILRLPPAEPEPEPVELEPPPPPGPTPAELARARVEQRQAEQRAADQLRQEREAALAEQQRQAAEQRVAEQREKLRKENQRRAQLLVMLLAETEDD